MYLECLFSSGGSILVILFSLWKREGLVKNKKITPWLRIKEGTQANSCNSGIIYNMTGISTISTTGYF
jgi:hypothetical protein